MFESPLMSDSLGSSKDLKTKIVQGHDLGEGYKKLSFKLSVSTVRNVTRKWKVTGTGTQDQEKYRSSICRGL